jgi:hypothetical protein
MCFALQGFDWSGFASFSHFEAKIFGFRLQSVFIPESVKMIDYSVFGNYRGMVSIKFVNDCQTREFQADLIRGTSVRRMKISHEVRIVDQLCFVSRRHIPSTTCFTKISHFTW